MESAKESIKQKASNFEIYGKMQAVFIEMDGNPVVRPLFANKRKYMFSWNPSFNSVVSPIDSLPKTCGADYVSC